MVDGTTQLVDVRNKKEQYLQEKVYWAFCAKHIKMVNYHYYNSSLFSNTQSYSGNIYGSHIH